MKRKRTFAQLLRLEKRGARLTKGERNRLRALKASLTRSKQGWSIADLKAASWSELSESDQYRLYQHSSAKAAATRRKRRPPKPRPPKKLRPLQTLLRIERTQGRKYLSKSELSRVLSHHGREGARVTNAQKRESKRIFKKDFSEVLVCLRQLQKILRKMTGKRWYINQKGTDNQQYAELRIQKGEWTSSAVLIDAMNEVDPTPLQNIPKLISCVLVRIGARQSDIDTVTIDRKKYVEEWKFVDFAQDGDVTWTQTAGSLLSIDQKYLVEHVLAISFTWFDEDHYFETGSFGDRV